MSPGPRPIAPFLAAVFALLLSACGTGASDTVDVVVIGGEETPFASGPRLGLAGQLVRASTAEGLVALDAQGRVIPALADRWIVTDDGRSYIFRLRDGTWRDGSELSARSARRALEAAIRAMDNTSLGLDLAGVREVRDMAGRVVEIRLARPIPDFLQMLAQPELGLLHRGQGAGPMAMDRDGAVAVLVPIAPSDLGLPEIADWENRTRTVRLRALDGKAALALFNGGEADLVLGGGIGDFPLTGSVGILRGTIQLDPVTGLFGLAVTHTDGFLSDPGQREALAMAIDRDGLITPFGLDGWRPTSRIVAPGLAGDGGTVGERWSEMPLDERRAAASARVSRWREARADTGDERAAAPVTLRIRLPSGPGGDILFTRLSADFAAIGISSVRARDGEAADLRLVEDVARYPRAEWFLNRFACAVNTGPCVRGADALVREAGAAAEPAERAALLAEAEAELTRANIYIPFGPPVRWSLVRGSVDAFATNPWGWHPLMPLALRPR